MQVGLIAWLVLFCVYIGLLLIGRYKWGRISPGPPVSATLDITISVIIPVRNESANIKSLLEDIAAQAYPVQYYEVLVVDDHSTDETVAMVKSFMADNPAPVRLLHAADNPHPLASPKKSALAYGISHAKGTHILTIDGDCRVGKYWLLSHAHALSRQGVMMATGPVFYQQENDAFQKAQGMELAALMGVTAISLDGGMAGMANGANMSFSLQAFRAVGGYSGNEHVPSGDDEFLLRKIHGQFADSVVFVKDEKAVVYTDPPPDLAQLFHQRRRWAGKWRLHKDIFSLALPVLVFLFHLGWLVLPLLLFVDFAFIWLILSTFILKSASEFLFLRAIRIFGGKKTSLIIIFALQVAYSWYVLFFGIAANIGGYQWKGRTYSGHTNDRTGI